MAWQITMQSPKGPRGMMGEYAKARRAALEAIGELWFQEIFPEHFKPAASQKYRYKKRTDAYLRKKRRMYGHDDPNTFTGRLKAKMMGKGPRIRATKKGLQVVWRGLPRYTFMTNTLETITTKQGDVRVVVVKRPDKVQELTAANKDDRVRLMKHFKTVFTGLLNKS